MSVTWRVIVNISQIILKQALCYVNKTDQAVFIRKFYLLKFKIKTAIRKQEGFQNKDLYIYRYFYGCKYIFYDLEFLDFKKDFL